MKPRKRKCKADGCDEWYIPRSGFQKACSYPCARIVARIQAERDRKRELKKARERLKTRSDWLKDAQAAFNAWVRERDKFLPCVSCGRHHKGQWHAGHYRTTAAAPELRFEPLNVHKQCAPCNNHKSGDIVNYRLELIERIGQDNVDWLEGPHEAKHYSIDDLRAIRDEYRRKRRELVAHRAELENLPF